MPICYSVVDCVFLATDYWLLATNVFGRLTYLIFELAWALPVILGMWAIGHALLWRAWRLLVVGTLVPTVYFSAADAVAIHSHIWTLNPQRIVGLRLGPLPLEEAVFFLVTNLMTVQGLVLLGNTGGPSLLQLLRRREDLPGSR